MMPAAATWPWSLGPKGPVEVLSATAAMPASTRSSSLWLFGAAAGEGTGAGGAGAGEGRGD